MESSLRRRKTANLAKVETKKLKLEEVRDDDLYLTYTPYL
jgi:hypothetical protein